jgi:hypothetical protein
MYWSEFMKAHMTLKNMEPSAKVAMTLSGANPRPSNIPLRAAETAAAVHANPEANPDDSERFREDILRRSEAPLRLAWRHGGLND